MLEVNGQHQVCQSIAILKFLEDKAGLRITDPIEAAKADAILQSSQELFAPLNPTVNFAVGDDFLTKEMQCVRHYSRALKSYRIAWTKMAQSSLQTTPAELRNLQPFTT